MGACEDVRQWIETAEDRRAPPPGHARHLATCEACRRKARILDAAVTLGAEVSGNPFPRAPSFGRIVELTEEARPERGRRGWIAVAAAASIAAAAIGISYLGGLPGSGEGPGPVAEVRPGQVVETTAEGTSLSAPSTGSVSLWPRTRLRVADWTPDDTDLWMDGGRIEASVRHREAGQRFRVRTEFAVVTVVGTRFIVAHRPGRSTEVTTLEGTVSVAPPDGGPARRVAARQTLVLGPRGVVMEGTTGEILAAAPSAATLPDLPPPPPFLPPASPPLPPDERLPPGLAERLAPPPARPVELASTLVPAVAPPGRVAPPDPPPPDPPPPDPPPPDPPPPDPRDLSAALDEARRLVSRGDTERAIAALRALEKEAGPTGYGVSALLADALRIAGRPREARDAYLRAIEGAGTGDRSALLVDLASLVQASDGGVAEAEALWKRYLSDYPGGRHTGRALWELSALAERAGRQDEAVRYRARIVDDVPGGAEAVPALVAVGRALLDRGDLDGAASWYERRVDSRVPAVAEAASVGMMRTRLQQGRHDDVRVLAAAYLKRFPQGARLEEVIRLIEAAGEP